MQTSGTEVHLEVQSSDGEKVVTGKGGFVNNISVSKIDDTHWKIMYETSSLANETEVKYLTFTLLDSNFKAVTQPYKKEFTLYKESKVDLETVLNFLDKSSVDSVHLSSQF